MAGKGKPVFFGSPTEAMKRFEELGYGCPLHQNPGDHWIDVITPDASISGEAVEESEARVQKFIDSYDPESAKLDDQNNEESSAIDTEQQVAQIRSHFRKLPWIGQFFWVYQRSIINSFRNQFMLILRVFQTLFTAILLGVIYFNIGDDQSTISDRTGVLFFAIINTKVITS